MKKHINNLLLPFVILIITLFPAALAANGIGDNSNYTVKEGDTLWNISSEKLKNPFLWKKLWKANSNIKNPDLIFPGQEIIIPDDITGLESVEEEKDMEPAEKEIRMTVPEKIPAKQVPVLKKNYLISREILANSGFISEVEPIFEGTVMGSPQQRNLIGRRDFVYIKISDETALSKKFYILSKPEEIIHPSTEKVVGYLIKIKGILETVGEENGNKKALILESYEEITKDDLLTPYYSIDLPLEPSDERRPHVEGVIAKVHGGHNAVGVYGIVYLDKGASAGIQIGDMFSIITHEKPNIPVGTLQIISIRPATSVAVVKKAKSEIKTGDFFKN